jgi:hypothetical protein
MDPDELHVYLFQNKKYIYIYDLFNSKKVFHRLPESALGLKVFNRWYVRILNFVQNNYFEVKPYKYTDVKDNMYNVDSHDTSIAFKIKGMKVKKDHFNIIIFDGSFVLINTLSSVYKKLKDENKLNMTKWDTINQNLLYQMKYIIENSVNQIVKTINEFDKRYKPETIYFVVDPKNKVDYTINESLYIPNEFKEYLLNELKNDKELEKLKLQEQESRKQRASKITDILKKCEEIDDMCLKNIYRQSNHFNEMASLTHLIRIINKYLVIVRIRGCRKC